jgi:hypothetical protein
MNSLSGAELFSGHRLFSAALLHHEPLALFIGETECARGTGFGRVHIAENLRALIRAVMGPWLEL